MKKLLLVFASIWSGLLLHAQFPLTDAQSSVCYDGVTPIDVFPNWQAYQTLDNLHDGAIDSTVCIDITESEYSATLDPAQFDITRPVFVKWSNQEGIALNENALYMLNLWLSDINLLLQDPLGCDEDLCSGIILKMRVPDNPEDMDEEPEIRVHKSEFMLNEFSGIGLCFPTEDFVAGNELIEIVFKVHLQPDASEFIFYEPYLEQVWLTEELTEASMVNYLSSPFEYTLGWPSNFLVRYEEPTFPSAEHVSFLDVYPVPNIAEQAVVNVTLSWGSSLNFQPFTAIQGGLVDGQTDVRHYVNLINDGQICLNFIVDLAIPPGNTYTHRKGHLESSWGTCMRFQPGARLRVAEHAHLEYGQLGMGMLATQSGAQIDMQHGAQMIVNCPWRMFNEPWQTQIEDVHVYLREHNQLIFGDYASLENFSDNAEMQLVIHLLGGYLDLGPLSDEERQHIRIEYPAATANLAWVSVQSPTDNGTLKFAYYVEKNTPGQMRLIASSGQEVVSQSINADGLYHLHRVDVSAVSPGIYTLVVEHDGQMLTKKIMVAQ
jgi:hypothetical protein